MRLFHKTISFLLAVAAVTALITGIFSYFSMRAIGPGPGPESGEPGGRQYQFICERGGFFFWRWTRVEQVDFAKETENLGLGIARYRLPTSAPSDTGAEDLYFRGDALRIPFWLFVVGFGAYPLLTAIVGSVRRSHRRRRGRCTHCGHVVQGVESGVCPGCGRSVGVPISAAE